MIELLICLALRSPPAANRIRECERAQLALVRCFDHGRTSANSIGLELDPIVPMPVPTALMLMPSIMFACSPMPMVWVNNHTGFWGIVVSLIGMPADVAVQAMSADAFAEERARTPAPVATPIKALLSEVILRAPLCALWSGPNAPLCGKFQP
jgi:hypothetical protein